MEKSACTFHLSWKILETGKLLLFTQKGVDFREKCGKASESYQTERNLGEFCRGMFQGLSSVTQSWTERNSYEKPWQYGEKGIYIEDRALSLLADATKQERDH